MSTPTGIVLRAIDTDGRETLPAYEAYGWDRVNEIIQATLSISHVARVEIVDINFTREGN